MKTTILPYLANFIKIKAYSVSEKQAQTKKIRPPNL
jgi:hypothetical protein